LHFLLWQIGAFALKVQFQTFNAGTVLKLEVSRFGGNNILSFARKSDCSSASGLIVTLIRRQERNKRWRNQFKPRSSSIHASEEEAEVSTTFQ